METEAAAAPTSAMDTDEQMAAEAKALVAAAIDAAIDAAHRAACIIVRAPAHSRMHYNPENVQRFLCTSRGRSVGYLMIGFGTRLLRIRLPTIRHTSAAGGATFSPCIPSQRATHPRVSRVSYAGASALARCVRRLRDFHFSRPKRMSRRKRLTVPKRRSRNSTSETSGDTDPTAATADDRFREHTPP